MSSPDRRTYIGGADAKIIAGVDPRKSIATLFYEKRGDIPSEDFEELPERMYWGTVFEDNIATRHSLVTGIKNRRKGFITHPKHDFIGGHIDRELLGVPGDMECKNRAVDQAFRYGPAPDLEDTEVDVRHRIPEEDYIQVQHYLGLRKGRAFCDLCVLIGGNELRIYRVRRNDKLIKTLVGLEVAFWNALQTGIAPDLDFHRADTKEILKALYPGTDGTTLVMPEELFEAHDQYQNAKTSLKEANGIVRELETKRDEARNRMEFYMQGASVLLHPDGGGYTRKEVAYHKKAADIQFVRFDWKRKIEDKLF